MKLNVNIEDELYFQFKAAMAGKHMTISEFVRRAMEDFLKAEEIVSRPEKVEVRRLRK